jgi:mRNA interferase MazF
MPKDITTKLIFSKNFEDWGNLKPKLNLKSHKPPLFKEKEMWWVKIGENIGSEVSGKNKDFTRTVIVHTKLSKYTFLGIPTTTQLTDSNGKERNGSWYAKIEIKGKPMLAVLSQIRVFDYRRLDKVVAEIDEVDFETIKQAFNDIYYKK